MPVDVAGLQTSALFSEPRVAVVPVAHRLAGKEAVSIHDLADEHLLQHPDVVPEWRSVAKDMHDRQRPAALAQGRSVEEKLEHVAAGRGFSVLPESAATYYQRSDVAWMPITDIPPSEVRLAWVATRHAADRRIRGARPGCSKGCVERTNDVVGPGDQAGFRRRILVAAGTLCADN